MLLYAETNFPIVKVLLSGNVNDFGKREVQEALQDVGVSQYFASTQTLLDWLRAQPSL